MVLIWVAVKITVPFLGTLGPKYEVPCYNGDPRKGP